MMEPEIRFCTSADGTRIAYSSYCEEGRPPIVRIAGWPMTEEMNWAERGWLFATAPLISGRCVLSLERRGLGASQRDIDHVSLAAQVDDLAAVIDHAGLDRLDLVGWLDGAAICASYAAQHPEKAVGLAMYCPTVRGDQAWREGSAQTTIDLIRSNWRMAWRSLADMYLPYAPAELRQAMRHGIRDGMSADVAVKHLKAMSTFDIRSLLPQIQARTIVVYNPAYTIPATCSQEVAALIPDSRFVQSPDPISQAALQFREFLDEGWESLAPGESLPEGMTAILFLDIADSTALTTKLGDAAYRERERELDAKLRLAITDAGGSVVEGKVLGDGVMAVFSAARRAIDAARRCRDLGSEAGLPLYLGIHAGDVEREGSNVHGGAVQVAARVQGEATAGEILVSQTVRDLARTSADVPFEDRGEHELKGVAEPVRLFAVRDLN